MNLWRLSYLTLLWVIAFTLCSSGLWAQCSLITADAGDDQHIEPGESVSLSGSVTYALGGYWWGGSGVFSDYIWVWNNTYTPSATEISQGYARLIFTTWGTSIFCPNVSDTVMIYICPKVPEILGPMEVCEFDSNVTYSTLDHVGSSYQWSVFGGSVLSGQGSSSINVAWDSTGPGYLYVTETGTCPSTAGLSTIARFDFDSTDLKLATVGSDALAVDSNAYSSSGAVQMAANCGGSKGIDLELSTSALNRGKMCMTYSFQRDESQAHFFERDGFLLEISGGYLGISYRVEDGTGGYTDVGPINTGYSPPNDDVFRDFTFCYDSATGMARLFANTTLIWSYQSTAERSLYWTGAGNAYIGKVMDGNCMGRPYLDWANIGIPVTVHPKPKPVIDGPDAYCFHSGPLGYSVTPVSGYSISWNVTNGTLTGSGSSVNVEWDGVSTGIISVTLTNNSTGCEQTVSKEVPLAPAPASDSIYHGAGNN